MTRAIETDLWSELLMSIKVGLNENGRKRGDAERRETKLRVERIKGEAQALTLEAAGVRAVVSAKKQNEKEWPSGEHGYQTFCDSIRSGNLI